MVYTEIITDSVHTWTIKIGRNEKENDTLIRNSNKHDLWFHLEDNPSPHGFISYNPPPNPDTQPFHDPSHTIIYKTALLVKKYSNCKHIPHVSVIYTKIENICLTKKLGTIIIKNKTNKINKINV